MNQVCQIVDNYWTKKMGLWGSLFLFLYMYTNVQIKIYNEKQCLVTWEYISKHAHKILRKLH